MPTERLTFTGASSATLSARLELPAARHPHAMALFAHCFTCSKDLSAAVQITRALADAGIGVLRFDFTGLGESEGDFEDTSFSSNVADLVAAAGFVAEQWEPPTLLVGHSFGGAAVLHAAAELPDVRAIATIGAPSDPEHVRKLFTRAEDEIATRGRATVRLAEREFTITREFLEDLRQDSMQSVLADLERPLLVIHSPVDEQVGIENAARLFEAARHPKSFVSLDGADHLLTTDDDARWAGSVIAAWAARWLAPAAGEDEKPVGDRVVTRTRDTYRTEVQARGHTFVADEPVRAGGRDEGPNPYDLLVASLGTCTGMTLRMYADRKEWPLEEVVVHLRHSKIHADDFDAMAPGARIDQIEREIEVLGDLDDEQRARLLEIANRCPVHRTLESDIRVVSKLKEA
ncbi:MAG TPA: alpha/beta fold hydrolase [Longimicrobiales bacterium]|nr:alpha/beta fold hydrolase [Longimicrobiales bacterium]